MTRKERNEILRIRYQLYRDMGYSSKVASKLRGKSLDVTPLKTSKKTGKVIKGKAYKNIRSTLIGPKDVNRFVDNARTIKNDTTYSRWGMLTQDPRYRDNTAKQVKALQYEHNLTTNQSYYFLHYMTVNNVSYKLAKKELLSSKEFEIYDKAKKRSKK